jgi:hypothetical protein
VNAPLASALLGNGAPAVLLRLAGNAEGVDAQRRAFGELGASSEVAPDIWMKLRAIEPAGASVVRLSDLPSEIERTWSAANVPGALVHASPARGIARTIASDAIHLAALKSATGPNGATCLGERLPADQWRAVAAPGSDLNTRVKQTFDPSNVLNPGILGESS